MPANPYGNVRVYIQQGNGIVSEISGFIREMTYTTTADSIDITAFGDAERGFIPAYNTASITIEGSLNLLPHDFMEQAKVAKEWQCEWCKRPNQRKDETCKSCGAVRPFIYNQ